MPNRLGDAASPYLRSHAGNPVDWWQWGPEPFEEARRRDVPVLVSIGYSTCHWCHVMARESFSDPETTSYLNNNVVAIKVDREEHAEVDSTYMAAAGAFTQNLGWPLNVFVTPDGRAFYSGTYWPLEPVQGVPSFRQVLAAVLDAWNERRDEVERNGAAIVDALAHQHPVASDLIVDVAPLIEALEAQEDPEYGGFGGAPKFPVAPVVRFLVEQGAPLGERTLDAMATSRLRDPVDGGFFRYATQRDWSDPHYERMLYDNAQLLAAYSLAGRAEIADGVASFLTRTLQQPAGGFASAQDSESTVEGRRVEGFYYTLDGPSRARLDPPPIDTKILTGWNGLAIEALALGGRLLDRPDWVVASRRAADFLLAEHVLADRLVRTSIGGRLSDAPSTLEDYGMLARGLLELSLTTGEVRYARSARDLVDQTRAAGDPFGLPSGGDPVLAGQGIRVDADTSDGAHPSGLSAIAGASLLLYELTADRSYRDAAAAAMQKVAAAAARYPLSRGSALGVMSRLAAPARHLVIVGEGEPVARARHLNDGVTAVVTQDQALTFAAAGFELFEGRITSPGAATVYLCEDFVCRLPVTY